MSQASREDDPEGSDFKKDRSQWQTAAGFLKGNWLAVTILALSLAATGGTIKNSGDQARQQRETAYDQRLADYEGCKRNNETRLNNVDNLRGDIRVFVSDVGFGRTVLDIPGVTDSPLGARVHVFIRAHRDAIKGKRGTIQSYRDVLAPVALPDDPLQADCEGQFPLGERGDPLPKPTVPKPDRPLTGGN